MTTYWFSLGDRGDAGERGLPGIAGLAGIPGNKGRFTSDLNVNNIKIA